MAHFKDCNGKEWTVFLDAPMIVLVRDECDGLYLAAPDGSGYEAVQLDDVKLVNALWIICKEQAKNDAVSEAQFGRALVGDAIDGAREALLQAILNFFPSRRREVVKAVGDKTEHLRKLAMETALQKINDPQVEQKILAQLEAEIDKQLSIQSSLPTSIADSAELTHTV